MNRRILMTAVSAAVLLGSCPAELLAWTPPEEIRWTAVIIEKSEPVPLDPVLSENRIRPIETDDQPVSEEPPPVAEPAAEKPPPKDPAEKLAIEKIEGWKKGDTYRIVEVWSDGHISEAWVFGGIYVQQVRGWPSKTLYANHVDSGGVAERMPFFGLSLLKPDQEGREVRFEETPCLYFETDDPFLAGIGKGRAKIWINRETGLPVAVEAGGNRTVFTFVAEPVVLPEPPEVFRRYRDGIRKRFVESIRPERTGQMSE